MLLIPLTLFIGVYYFAGRKYYFISLLILLECMLPFFLIFEGRKPQAGSSIWKRFRSKGMEIRILHRCSDWWISLWKTESFGI